MTLLRRKGRVYGGIHILVAPPSQGKSYIVTWIVDQIFKEKKRKVFSNYPIRSLDGKDCSFYIDKTLLMSQNLNGQVIVLDEGHKLFWSRNFKNFTDEEKNWWSTAGHNEQTIYILTQELGRIDVIIQDVATLIWDIQKVSVPFLDIPLWFNITQWSSKEAYMADQKGMLNKPPFREFRVLFSQNIADMYDTHFFGTKFGLPYGGIRWDDYLLLGGEKLLPPYPTLLQRIPIYIRYYYDNLLYSLKLKKIDQESEFIYEYNNEDTIKKWTRILTKNNINLEQQKEKKIGNLEQTLESVLGKKVKYTDDSEWL